MGPHIVPHTASEPVELHGAYVWTCPECGQDSFHRGVTLEREQVEGMVPPDAMATFEAYQGSWMTAPDTVRLGAAGVAIERDVNARLRAENERLREALSTIRGMMCPTVPGGAWEVANAALDAEPTR